MTKPSATPKAGTTTKPAASSRTNATSAAGSAPRTNSAPRTGAGSGSAAARPDNATQKPAARPPAAAQVARNDQVKVNMNTSGLRSSYANVCSVTSTREEVVLNFGTNETWERGHPEVQIEVSNRIIMTPFAAQRLADAMNRLIEEYETRYGKLPVADSQ